LDDVPIGGLLVLLFALVSLASFFSCTETALMTLNRHWLHSQAQQGNRSARSTERLLLRPDRLIGIVLFGKIVVHVLAALVTATIAIRAGGSIGLVIGAVALTMALLVLGELLPRAYGSLHPERVALASVWIYLALSRVLAPLIWLAEAASEACLKVLGRSADGAVPLSEEERAALAETGLGRHQRMLSSILDLDTITVEDIMIPRSEIASIDIQDDWDDILDVLRTTPHTRLPVCDGNLDNVVGILHMKKVVHALAHGELSRESLHELAKEREGYFVPEGTTLSTQLLNFQRDRRRIALVVDEYGDVQGLVTLEDILEEIVGEFTSDPARLHRDIHRDPDGSYVANGTINIRVLNKTLGWELPTDGPRTLNGLILEYLETIPEPGTGLRLGDISVEILQTADNAVKTARLRKLEVAGAAKKAAGRSRATRSSQREHFGARRASQRKSR
jgi:Mg2+/Co2+ transporter CorB